MRTGIPNPLHGIARLDGNHGGRKEKVGRVSVSVHLDHILDATTGHPNVNSHRLRPKSGAEARQSGKGQPDASREKLRLHKRLAVRKVKGNRGRSQPAIVTRLLRNHQGWRSRRILKIPRQRILFLGRGVSAYRQHDHQVISPTPHRLTRSARPSHLAPSSS